MGRRKKKREEMGAWQRFQHDMRTRLVSGLLVVVPLGITALVLKFLYDITAGVLTQAIREILGPLPPLLIPVMVPVLSILLFLVALYLIGLGTTAFLGRRMIHLMERIIEGIPLVKTIYGASKQVVNSLSFRNEGQDFKSVVLIEFPRPGMKCLGFMTGMVNVSTRTGPQYKVFIPTTPNPTTGYLEIVAPEDLEFTDLSVEDAIKFIMSGGIVAPDTLTLVPGNDPRCLAAGEKENGKRRATTRKRSARREGKRAG
jgi:uncharacterized membrane protein